jgi:putative CocE/NonD family hydrolase
MLIEAGPRDQRPGRALPDYGLVYEGAPLDRALTVAGSVRVSLAAESDCPDTDFVAKLVERMPDGRAMLLMDGVQRAMFRNGTAEPLKPGEIVRLTIELGHIHHTIAAGSRIEIDVTSSNFPRRARNTNSGHALLAGDGDADIRIARNTVHHEAATPSYLELPVLAG